jgi:hypothetical protein
LTFALVVFNNKFKNSNDRHKKRHKRKIKSKKETMEEHLLEGFSNGDDFEWIESAEVEVPQDSVQDITSKDRKNMGPSRSTNRSTNRSTSEKILKDRSNEQVTTQEGQTETEGSAAIEILRKQVMKFLPIVYLHTDEKYPPLDFDRYLRDAQLKRESDGQIFQPTSPDEYPLSTTKLGQWLLKYPILSCITSIYTLFLPLGMKSNCIAHPNYDLDNQVPVYVHLFPDEDDIDIVYVNVNYLYAYNGASAVCGGLFYQGEHYADLENCQLKINWKTDTLISMYYSRHNGGFWYDAKDLTYERGRPIVFSALQSHASYTEPKNHCRFWCSVVDKTNYGCRWNTVSLVEWITDEHPLWTTFKGDYGDGAVSSLRSSTWYGSSEKNHNYGQNFWFCD